jgi:hypothetical protein
MKLRLSLLLGALTLALIPWASSGQGPAGKTFLLNVSAGQRPNDTNTPATKFSLEEHPDLGKALKVLLADSFGDTPTRVTNWKPFTTLAFDAVNLGETPAKIHFEMRHKQSKDYPTRVDREITLKPGKNEIRLPLASLTNSNGSAADLANVVRWYVSKESESPPLSLVFSDFWFEGGAATTPPAGTPVTGGGGPLVGYHVKGKIGALDVDLTVTPFSIGGGIALPKSGPTRVGGDPARLQRIKASKMPKIDGPISFDTPEADAICSALEIFPADNPWNLLVEDWPLHPNSDNIIASIGAKKPLRYQPDMGFVLVPPTQKKVDVKLVGYPEESDPGPYPVPDNVPIEGWPSHYKTTPKLKDFTLEQVQRDTAKEGGDRHAIVVDPISRTLVEFYQMKKTDAGWQASAAAFFDLKSNKLRPDGWTSSDAAGLPIFPSIVRYDELKRGVIDHALRVTVVKSRRAYVYPATHFASPHTDENLPRMGERIRLKKDFKIEGFSPEVTTILRALQRYGMLVADNGIDWALSVAPDQRIGNLHLDLRKVPGSAFEVVTPPPGYQPAP